MFLRFVFCIVALSSPVAVVGAEIHLQAECRCPKALVTLGDVAEILAVDGEQRRRLGGVELFPTPPAGRSRLARVREIRDLLARRGVDLRTVRFGGASAVKITGPTSPAAANATRVSPTSRQTGRAERIASHEDNAGERVVVAARPLRRGQIVQAGDVELGERQKDVAGAVTDLSETIGREVTRSIRPGQAVQQTHVRAPLLVQRNETVTVYVRTRGIQVRTTAKALEDGAKGELIALQSELDRGERFIARVVGHKEAEIFAGGPLVEQASLPARKKTEEAASSTTSRGSLFELRVATGRGQRN